MQYWLLHKYYPSRTLPLQHSQYVQNIWIKEWIKDNSFWVIKDYGISGGLAEESQSYNE